MKGTITRFKGSDITDWYQSTIFINNRMIVGFGVTPSLALADSFRSIK